MDATQPDDFFTAFSAQHDELETLSFHINDALPDFTKDLELILSARRRHLAHNDFRGNRLSSIVAGVAVS